MRRLSPTPGDAAAPPRLRVICNARPGMDRITCGQAAIATLLAFHRLGPFTSGPDALDDGGAIDFVRESFPPDLAFGLGTTAFRLAAALRAYGLTVERAHSGWFGSGADEALARLRAHAASGHPVPVCLDDGCLGGARASAHWAIVAGMDGERVSLGNCGLPEPLALDAFMAAWACRWLPYTHNHCAILTWR